MAESRINRTKKKQLGQFMTPRSLSKQIVDKIIFEKDSKILEPSFGEGSFILAIIDRLMNLFNIDLDTILTEYLWGIEYDTELYNICIQNIIDKYGYIPENHNLINCDFFEFETDIKFTNVCGNPPFGGTIDYKYQEELDKKYGTRNGEKIKKETYSFFMVKSHDHLDKYGRIDFICSDTFLTIKTMSGLRKFLTKTGTTDIKSLEEFSEETDYPMVIIKFIKDYGLTPGQINVFVNDEGISENIIELTDNYSWNIKNEYIKYFRGTNLSDYILASGGLSTGKNEYFIREIDNDKILEPYTFTYFDDPITLEKEISKAKLNKIGDKKIKQIIEQESNGETQRNVNIELRDNPIEICLPNDDYCYYNKATKDILYSKPKNVIYWKDNGDACLTYKKNGNWYLHGVGGANFFKKEGLTWQLISKKINARYLPEGYILDNSSPVAILKDGINKNELFFIIGWLLTDKATEIQKEVINHTKNIQNKDIERLPYPFWVDEDNKQIAIKYIQDNIKILYKGGNLPKDFLEIINKLYNFF